MATAEQEMGEEYASQAVGPLLSGTRRPGALGGRPRWTKAQVEGNQGSSLESHAGRRPAASAEQTAQAAVADGDLDYHIEQRAIFLGQQAEDAPGFLVTEPSGSLWSGTVLSRRAAGKKAAQVLLGGGLFLALLRCGREPAVQASAQTTYTLAEAITARAVLQTQGQSITIEGDGPYTIQLWPHVGAANYQLTQLIQSGQGAALLKGTPDRNSFAGMLINAQGEHLPMLLDLSFARATEANHAFAEKLVEQPHTAPATTARSVAGIMVQVSDVQLHIPLGVPGYEPSTLVGQALTQGSQPALPYQDHDYVFWLRLPDQEGGALRV